MPVDSLASFPTSLAAGDTLRIEGLSDVDYPSSDWTLEVVLRGADGALKTFPAEAGDNNGFDLVVAGSESGKLKAQAYAITLVYNETGGGDRATVRGGTLQVTADPTKSGEKSLARKTLEAMEDALYRLSKGSNATVSFNGHSFSKKNLRELQDAIDRQRAIVDREEVVSTSTKRYRGIFVRFGRNYCADGLNP